MLLLLSPMFCVFAIIFYIFISLLSVHYSYSWFYYFCFSTILLSYLSGLFKTLLSICLTCDTLTFQGGCPAHDTFLFWVPCQGCGSQPDYVSFPTRHCDVSLQSWLYVSLSLVPVVFSQNLSTCSCILFDVFMWRCEFSVLLLCHLELSPLFSIFKILVFFHFLEHTKTLLYQGLYILYLSSSNVLFLTDIPFSTSRIFFINYHLSKSWSSYPAQNCSSSKASFFYVLSCFIHTTNDNLQFLDFFLLFIFVYVIVSFHQSIYHVYLTQLLLLKLWYKYITIYRCCHF